MSVYESIIKGLDEAVEYSKGSNKNVRVESFTVTETAPQSDSFNVPVKDVALWLINYNNSHENADFITNLKLQKLLYYAQALSLKYTGKTLFNESIYAWEYGPVVNEVYQEYKDFGRQPIQTDEKAPDFSGDVRVILEDTYEEYGQFSAWKLVEMTHNDPAWKETKRNCNISIERMKELFGR